MTALILLSASIIALAIPWAGRRNRGPVQMISPSLARKYAAMKKSGRLGNRERQ